MIWMLVIILGFIVFWVVVLTYFDITEHREIRRKVQRLNTERPPDLDGLVTHWPSTSVWGPVRSQYAGNNSYAALYHHTWEWGVSGILNEHLVFRGIKGNQSEILLRSIQMMRADDNDLTLYQRMDDEWHVYRFRCDGLAAYLHTYYQIPVGECPDEAQTQVRMQRQTIYGAWEDVGQGTLSLIPDRLLFDWRDLIHLTHLRHIGIIRSEVDMLDHTLEDGVLRLDHELPSEWRQTLGFEMPYPRVQEWARVLSVLTGIPVVEEAGRKKKEMTNEAE